jgi:hypothetical protein
MSLLMTPSPNGRSMPLMTTRIAISYSYSVLKMHQKHKFSVQGFTRVRYLTPWRGKPDLPALLYPALPLLPRFLPAGAQLLAHQLLQAVAAARGHRQRAQHITRLVALA